MLQITFGDGTLALYVSGIFGKKHAKTPRGNTTF